MQDDELVDKEQVALNLLVEFIGQVYTAHVVRTWLCPLSADLTRIANLGNEIEDILRYPNSFQESLHYWGRCMPPADV